MELREAYLKMQDNCGIDEGDTVKVLRKAENYEMGWGTFWEETMNEAIGNTYKVIIKKGTTGIAIDFKKSGSWNFPFFVLELVEKKKEHKSPEVKSHALSNYAHVKNQLILMKAILVIAKNEELMNHVEMQDLEQRIKEIESNDE
jgi:hypothetical protein